MASLQIASTRAERRRGLIGRDGFEGALLIEPARSVHSVGMRFPIDVAHLSVDGTVLRICTMGRNRIGLPVLRAHAVIEATAGAFRSWELARGQILEIDRGEPRPR